MNPITKISIRKPLIVMIIIILGIVWTLNTINTGNPIWFIPYQPEYEPTKFVVRNYGTDIEILPGSPEYDMLTVAMNETLSKFQNAALVDIGLGDETLRRYHAEELVLEAYYGQLVQFNTTVRMAKVNQLLIPIDATHQGFGYVFIGYNGEWLIGAMQVTDDTPIMDAMRQLNYIQE